MFRQASSLWTVLLEQYCHRWCLSSCLIKFRTPFLLLPTLIELHDVLHQMDFESPLIFGENPISMLNFFKWIKEHVRGLLILIQVYAYGLHSWSCLNRLLSSSVTNSSYMNFIS